MSFPDSRPPFMLQPPFAGNEAAGFWPQFPVNNEQTDLPSQFEYPPFPPFKRPRNSEDDQSNSMPYPPMNPRMCPPNPPVNKGISNIFFKTRMCAKFRVGLCRNGENCNFAHGVEDMRQPPPNWQELVGGREEDRGSANWDDDQRIIHKMKLCKKFYNGEECPYGERCNFLHEDPKKYRDDSGRFRESSAISIGTTGPNESGSDQPEGNRPINAGLDAYWVNGKPAYWKTKICSKWEATGQCPFGEKCHFAHGQSELQVPGGRIEGELGSTGSIPMRPVPVPSNDASLNITFTGITSKQEGMEKKCLLKWKGPKKINRIYADWIDDLLPVQSLPSIVES
ncbi:hypothetical protein L1049_000239 [Liquidambar formosana]|uniref:C3H1-type domain-containing protein n=1 Tax=Liquidambar formosana TaxID=63359 RepID=A0AAP0N8F3_LIQFO